MTLPHGDGITISDVIEQENPNILTNAILEEIAYKTGLIWLLLSWVFGLRF